MFLLVLLVRQVPLSLKVPWAQMVLLMLVALWAQLLRTSNAVPRKEGSKAWSTSGTATSMHLPLTP